MNPNSLPKEIATINFTLEKLKWPEIHKCLNNKNLPTYCHKSGGGWYLGMTLVLRLCDMNQVFAVS